LCVYAMSLLDKPEEVFMWDGGIPQTPRPPLNYLLTFNIEGLINEYYGTTKFLRDRKIVNIPCFFKDVVVIRVKCLGEKDGRPAQAQVDLLDFYDEETGFTAMERITGWDISIVAIMMANGQTKKGAVPLELAISSSNFVHELGRRGISVSERITYLG
ncbi:MAG: saccharopine dehydrogenase C-terminal domain-containing protein, partial [Promethearchaeota archaeon]